MQKICLEIFGATTETMCRIPARFQGRGYPSGKGGFWIPGKGVDTGNPYRPRPDRKPVWLPKKYGPPPGRPRRRPKPLQRPSIVPRVRPRPFDPTELLPPRYRRLARNLPYLSHLNDAAQLFDLLDGIWRSLPGFKIPGNPSIACLNESIPWIGPTGKSGAKLYGVNTPGGTCNGSPTPYDESFVGPPVGLDLSYYRRSWQAGHGHFDYDWGTQSAVLGPVDEGLGRMAYKMKINPHELGRQHGGDYPDGWGDPIEIEDTPLAQPIPQRLPVPPPVVLIPDLAPSWDRDFGNEVPDTGGSGFAPTEPVSPTAPAYPPHVKPGGGDEPYPSRPPIGTKEKKGNWPLVGLLFGLWDGATEANDFVDAVFDALPDRIKRQYKGRGAVDKASFIGENIDNLDVFEAIGNVVANAVEDRAIGKLLGAADKAGVGLGFDGVGYIKQNFL